MNGLGRCYNVIIGLLLLLACETVFAAPDFEACGDIPDDKVLLPDGVLLLQLHANGTRNYTCSDPGGAATIGDNQGAVFSRFNYNGNLNETAGSLYSNSEDHVIMVVDYPPQNLVGQAEMDHSIGDPRGTSPIFQPSPRNDSIPWARWRVLNATGVLENVTYVTRYDTDGGKKPEKCPPGRSTAEVPFKAVYLFYTCNSDASTSTTKNGSLKLHAPISAVFLATFVSSILLLF
jgi:Protein of unknown function (DUF3455)